MSVLSLSITAGDYILWFIIIAFVMFFIREKRNRCKSQGLEKLQKSEYENRLMAQGVKITVSFDDCKVNTKKRYSTKPASNSGSVQALNSFLDSRNSVVTTQNTSSVIEIKVKINGSTKTLKSCNLAIDKETLLIKLYMQKEIEVYYDVHTRDYFIDLHFLD